MKGFLKLSLALAFLSFGISCSDDEPAKNPLVGSWVIDSYTFENFPSEYSRYEGGSSSTLFGEDKYELIITPDSYTRTLSLGSQVETESGEWSEEDGFLTLDPTGAGLGITEEFEIEIQTGSDLVMRASISDFLTSNTYADTVSTAYEDYLDSLATLEDDTKLLEELNKIYKLVTFDIVYDFDLQK